MVRSDTHLGTYEKLGKSAEKHRLDLSSLIYGKVKWATESGKPIPMEASAIGTAVIF